MAEKSRRGRERERERERKREKERRGRGRRRRGKKGKKVKNMLLEKNLRKLYGKYILGRYFPIVKASSQRVPYSPLPSLLEIFSMSTPP